MARSIVALCCVSLFLLAGCGGLPGQIELGPAPEADARAPDEDIDEFEELKPAVRGEKHTKFFDDARRAPECPEVKLWSVYDEAQMVQLGRQGVVTLVVFWSAETSDSLAAAKLAWQLDRRYGGLLMRTIGVAEKTAAYRLVPGFLEAQRIGYQIYYDVKFNALKKLGSAVRSRGEPALPSVFLVDREGRLRFYRRGLAYTIRGRVRGMAHLEEVLESQPEGNRIEDYLVKLLEEES